MFHNQAEKKGRIADKKREKLPVNKNLRKKVIFDKVWKTFWNLLLTNWASLLEEFVNHAQLSVFLQRVREIEQRPCAFSA